jgi:hypothetical protein
MKKIVIMPGGFHPFHAGHMALYDAAREAFPSADVFVAATDDTSGRPFPFAVKKFLAQQAGVPGNRFIRVKSPFRAEEITQMYDPNDTQLIFVRSEKDKDVQPRAGGTKRDGTPAYLQPYKRNGLEPFSKHGYMAYLPTVQFGPGMTSATEIRAKWPEMEPEQKMQLVKILYPSAQTNEQAAGKIVDMFDQIMATQTDENMSGAQASLLGAPVGVGAGQLTPTPSPMPNGPERVPKGQRMDQTYEEDDRVTPQGGLGSYTADALKNNLAMGLRDIAGYLKGGNYEGVYHLLYQDPVFRSKLEALKDIDQQVDEDYIDEKWSARYKRSIDCDNPRGFSQRAHCAGRKK